MRKLNLGCGIGWLDRYPDYEGLDIHDYGQKYVGDVKEILPFIEREVYTKVMANHFLEHFSQDDLQFIFKQVHRILQPGGTFKFVVPHMDKDRAFILSHKTFFNETVCHWLGEDEARDVYDFGNWEVIEVITNHRKDIHVTLKRI